MITSKFLSVVGSGLLLLGLVASAQELRDPTLPPSEGGGMGASGGAALIGTEGLSVIVRDGKPYLVVGTRLVAPGQKVGQFKVERITEAEVWLRDGKELRKLPRFAGIQRSVPKPADACVGKAKKGKSATPHKPHTSAKTPPPIAPCEGYQPEG